MRQSEGFEIFTRGSYATVVPLSDNIKKKEHHASNTKSLPLHIHNTVIRVHAVCIYI